MDHHREIHEKSGSLTKVLEHLIALIENKHLQVVEVEGLVFGKVQDATRSANDDVRGLVALKQLLLLLERLTAQDAFRSHVGHEL